MTTMSANERAGTITLSLISHTNAGKTTLARTLLAQDVGEVRDAAHVTTEATEYTLIETADGDRLALWDTPGFGDSARLARRLAQESKPIVWFLAQMWDRFRDRAFFLSQQAVRNVRDRADVVLYLVNASEHPADAGYLAPELAVLEWMQKPVLVLLNQTGPLEAPPARPAERPRPASGERGDDDLTRWRTALADRPLVRDVIAFDAFARCWVQEFTLFAAIGPLLSADHAAPFARLVAAWRSRRFDQLDRSMRALAAAIASAACTRVAVPRTAMLRKLGSALGVGDDPASRDAARAMTQLAQRASTDLRTATDEIIALYGLSGRAAAEVEAHIEADIAREGPLDEGKAAAMGGVVSGALAGLAADLATGGLTLGAGMLTGAVVGALGGAGFARALNVARGQSEDVVRWDDAFIERLIVQALLRYLAVAHYGRGRGNFVEAESPALFRAQLAAAMASRQQQLAAIFAQRLPQCDTQAFANALTPVLRDITLAVLAKLYPDTLPDAS